MCNCFIEGNKRFLAPIMVTIGNGQPKTIEGLKTPVIAPG